MDTAAVKADTAAGAEVSTKTRACMDNDANVCEGYGGDSYGSSSGY